MEKEAALHLRLVRRLWLSLPGHTDNLQVEDSEAMVAEKGRGVAGRLNRTTATMRPPGLPIPSPQESGEQ